MKKEATPKNAALGLWDVEHEFDYESTGGPLHPGYEWETGAIVKTTRIAVGTAPASVTTFEVNDFGNPEVSTDSLGRATQWEYHPILDPDGDGTDNWEAGLANLDYVPGYLFRNTVDPGRLEPDDGPLLHRSWPEDPIRGPARGHHLLVVQRYGPGVSHRQGRLVAGAGRIRRRLWKQRAGRREDADLLRRQRHATKQSVYNDNPDFQSPDAAYVDTLFLYDSLDRLVETRAELVHPDSTGSPAWVKTFWVRDSMGRIVRQINTDGSAISAVYDQLGRVVEHRKHANYATLAGGEPADVDENLTNAAEDAWVEFHYNGAGQMEWARDAEGAQENFYYDAYGRRYKKRDPAGSYLAHGFDANGNVTFEAIGTGTGGDYGVGSPPLKATEYLYDARSRLTEKRERWLSPAGAPMGDGYVTTAYGYDSEDQLETVADDAGEVTQYHYDDAGREYRMTHPTHSGADYEQYFLDPNGNRTRLEIHESTAAGAVTYAVEYEYDDLNRQTRTRRGPGTSIEAITEQQFDSLGNAIRTIEPRSDGLASTLVGTRFRFDTQKRVVEASEGWQSGFTAPHAAGLITTTKTYSPYGDLLAEEDDSGNATTYLYDGIHRRTRITYAACLSGGWRTDSDCARYG